MKVKLQGPPVAIFKFLTVRPFDLNIMLAMEGNNGGIILMT